MDFTARMNLTQGPETTPSSIYGKLDSPIEPKPRTLQVDLNGEHHLKRAVTKFLLSHSSTLKDQKSGNEKAPNIQSLGYSYLKTELPDLTD